MKNKSISPMKLKIDVIITIPVISANLYSYLSAKTASEIAAGIPL
ncbi:MAG: hypothetical protein P9M03_04405 [Candidatus Theseobacter exili]|nr:hypothetical protein [Candidatus Theseobacter exili]